MTVASTITIPPSESGLYKVDLSKPFERLGRKFVYKPGAEITVTLAVLEEMIEAGAVAHVTAG